MLSLNEKAAKLLLPPDIHLDLFDKMIVPILLYGCEIWGYGNLEPLEIFYRKFIKRMLCIQQNTPNCMVYGEVGKYPLKIQIQLRMLSYWAKISEGKELKLSTLVYKLIFALHINGTYHSPWLLKIKEILCDNGYPTFWYSHEKNPPLNYLKATISSQLKSQFLKEWTEDVFSNSRCTFYRTFKDTLCFEPYLKDLTFLERMSLSKIRTGSHNLPIAKHRYTKNPEDDLSCKYCNASFCDEYHTLFECEFFNEKREIYLKKFYFKKPSAYKTNSLFNTSKRETTNLAIFCKHILSHFK